MLHRKRQIKIMWRIFSRKMSDAASKSIRPPIPVFGRTLIIYIPTKYPKKMFASL